MATIDGGGRVISGRRVLVGIPTFRRPDELARLLDTLPAVVSEAAETQGATVDVLVVDNDPGRSALAVVEAAWVRARYVSEPTPGIAAVRNRILSEADGYELLAFIDDDETPSDREWLASLLRTQTSTGAHVVAGPVRTVAERPLDPWLIEGGFYAREHRSHLRTGDEILRAATNNVLLDLDFVRGTATTFDLRFGRTGGEDSFFTSQLHRRRAHMVWCTEAVVLDHLPPERWSRKFALERTRGMAAAEVRVSLALESSARGRIVQRVRGFGISLARGVVGSGRVMVAVVARSQRQNARGKRELARARGGLEGTIGRLRGYYGDSGSLTQGVEKSDRD